MGLGVDVALARLDAGRENVVFPITSFAPGSRSMEVPLIVRPGPPAVMVVPSMEKAVGLGVNVWPAMVYTERGMVLLPITKSPPDCSCMDVPLIFRPGPPAVMVVPSMEKAVGLGVNVWLAIAYTDKGMVLPPITKSPPDCSCMGVPEIVTPGPPAVMVVPSMGKAVGLGVNVWPAMV